MKNNPVQITREKERNKIEPVETGETIALTEEEIRLFDTLALVLEYPVDGWIAGLETCVEQSNSAGFRKSGELTEFLTESKEMTLTQLQELYTRTFDLNPVCALEIGYHLFGEDYKRGEFLAKLRESENPYELGQESQLPDFMPVVLRLLGRMDDAELRASLIGYCLLPALKKMQKPFEKGENPYGRLIRFASELLREIADKSVAREGEARYQYA